MWPNNELSTQLEQSQALQVREQHCPPESVLAAAFFYMSPAVPPAACK